MLLTIISLLIKNKNKFISHPLFHYQLLNRIHKYYFHLVDRLVKFLQKEGNFCYIPEKYRFKKIYLEGLKYNGYVIGYFPEKFITEEQCIIAVNQTGLALRDIPVKFRSEKVCLQALIKDYQARDYVPICFKDNEDFIIEFALQKKKV